MADLSAESRVHEDGGRESDEGLEIYRHQQGLLGMLPSAGLDLSGTRRS
jgi:hypothetical protein